MIAERDTAIDVDVALLKSFASPNCLQILSTSEEDEYVLFDISAVFSNGGALSFDQNIRKERHYCTFYHYIFTSNKMQILL